MTDASVDDFWGGVDGGVSHVEGLVFTRLTGVLWKHPSTHFLKLLTGESSGSPVVTHWTARNAWNWTTGLAVLFGELSVLKLCVFLGCSATSIVFDGVFSSFSSFSRVSVQQTKDTWEFFSDHSEKPFHLKFPRVSLSHSLISKYQPLHKDRNSLIRNCFRCFRTVRNAKLYKR